jgi:peptidoglycan/LPS O-acetylase OafA/YrhL
VVLYHIRTAGGPSLPPAVVAFLAKGYLAVDFFFILSGFVIWLNYAEQVRTLRLAGVPRFLWRRLARIYPLHLFMLMVGIAFALACLAAGKPVPPDFPVRELPLHLLLIQNWGFTDELTWNHPAWSISCEFAVYLLFPLVAMVVNWNRWSTVALLATVGVQLAALHIAFAISGMTTLGDNISHFGLLRCVLEFGMGTIFSALWRRWRALPATPFMVSTLAALCGISAYLAGVAETLAIPFAFGAVSLALALSSNFRFNPLNGAIIHRLGDISYATYMVHTLLFLLFKLLFVRDAANVPLVLLAAFVLLTLLASFALHQGVERPAQRWLNRRAFATEPK